MVFVLSNVLNSKVVLWAFAFFTFDPIRELLSTPSVSEFLIGELNCFGV